MDLTEKFSPMEAPQSNLSWKELYNQRLEWAWETGHEFLDDLESEAVKGPATRQMQGSDRHEAVVVGESQVGKTRLILRMHGISDSGDLDRVEDILRGESDQGNPSTATATTYSVSPTDCFRIERPSDPKPSEVSEEEARTRLKDLRQQMESGRLSEGFSLKIELPRSLVPEKRRDDNLNIVDLPGLDGVSKREREYARSLASTHLHRAHLVMLVGRASEIPHLFDWIRDESGIFPPAAWTHQKSRFAVVLTHSASAYSRQKQIAGEDGPNEEEEYRELFEKDLREEEKNWDGFEATGEGESICRLDLYPVELGSPDGPLDKESKRLVEQWTDSLIQNLVQRAKGTSSRLADLRFLVENYRSVEIHVKNVLSRFDDKIEKLKTEKKKTVPEFKERKDRMDDLYDKKKKIKEKKSNLPSVKEIKEEDIPDRISDRNDYERKIATPSRLLSYLRHEEGRIMDSVRELADNLRERRQRGEMSSQDLTCSREKLVSMAESVLSDYTGRLKSKFSNMSFIYKQIKHRNDAESSASRASRSLKIKIEKKLKVEMGVRHSELRDEVSEVKRKMRENRNILKDIEKKRIDIDERINDLKQERQEKCERMQEDLRRWQRLRERFEDAFDQEVKSVKARMVADVPEEEQVLLALYLRQIAKDYDAMIEGTL